MTPSHFVKANRETDTVHTSEGQRHVTPQQTTAHVPSRHVGSDDNCYVTAYESAKLRPGVCGLNKT